MAPRDSKLHDKTTYREISDDLCWKLHRCIQHYLKEYSPTNGDFSKGESDIPIAAVSYLSKHLFAKMNDPRKGASSQERRTAAIVKWLGVEARNVRTNERINKSNPTFLLGTHRDRMMHHGVPRQTTAWDLLFRAKGLITRILGTCPSGDELTTFLLEGGGFTSGASTSKKRTLDNLSRKYTERLDATPRMLSLLRPSDISDRFEGWAAALPKGIEPFRLVKGNILFTVPKNAEIDRVACKEPDLNLFCQKAVGNHIRRRLRVCGIDLNDQSRNQVLAQHAYKRGYATIDLSSASDSLTTGLVEALLPPSWFSLLMTLRSPKTFIDGASHTNAMISSMGNGFTFELESLIFYALAQAVRLTWNEEVTPLPFDSQVVGVYGDDLIVSQVIAQTLIALLGWCGFKVNASKSFIRGPLFESCGKHYYLGHDVSPFYIREPLSDISDLILVLNQLRDWMIRTGIDLFETTNKTRYSFYEIWTEFKVFVPRQLHGGWDLKVRTSLVTLGAQRCKLVPKMREVRRVVETYQVGMLLARLHGLPEDRGYESTDLTILESQETAMFPEAWTGKWLIRRSMDPSMFFGVATAPLWQELCS